MNSDNKVRVIVSSQRSSQINPNQVARRHKSIKYLSVFLSNSNNRRKNNVRINECEKAVHLS